MLAPVNMTHDVVAKKVDKSKLEPFSLPSPASEVVDYERRIRDHNNSIHCYFLFRPIPVSIKPPQLKDEYS